MTDKLQNKNFSIDIGSLEEMESFAKNFLDNLRGFNKNKALVIALSGNLGSGKTTFLRFLGKKLGIKERVTSPTFVLMHEHNISQKSKVKSQKFKSKFKSQNNLWDLFNKSGRQKFFHLDCYRVSEKDILDLGLEDLMADKKNIVAIEWADKIKKFLPKAIWLEFKIKGENEREIKIKII